MYARYKISEAQKGHIRYTFVEPVSLFGRNSGFIPWLLKPQIPPGQGEDFRWHVDLPKALAATQEYVGSALVINLKPKQSKTNVSLYELLDVWGYASHGWCPILIRLRDLVVDEDPELVRTTTFERNPDDCVSIYEFLYIAGSVRDGCIEGKWVPPPVSPTNAALLWPDAMRYFLSCIANCTPHLFDDGH
jgi:hypothetical protein